MPEIGKVEEMEGIANGGKHVNRMEVMEKMGEMEHMEEVGEMDAEAGDGHGPLLDVAYFLSPPCFHAHHIDHLHFLHIVNLLPPSGPPLLFHFRKFPLHPLNLLHPPNLPHTITKVLMPGPSDLKVLKPRSCALKDFDAQGIQDPKQDPRPAFISEVQALCLQIAGSCISASGPIMSKILKFTCTSSDAQDT